MITLTKNAAGKIAEMREGEEKPYLRVSVDKGGCSGFEYGMGFDDKVEGDILVECEGVEIVMKGDVAEALKGTRIDFDDGLNGKGFEIFNPNAKNTCGCGKSFN